MTKKLKIPVTERALIMRLNRRLKADDQRVRTTRENSRARLDCGVFYIYDFRRNFVLGTNVDLAELAKEMDALKPYEILVDSGGEP